MVGFEITSEDVATVLEAHGVIDADEYGAKHYEDESERVFALLTPEDKARIGAVEGDVEEMTDAALSNLEDVLFEKGVLNEEDHDWKFAPDGSEDNEDDDDPHVVIKIREGSKPVVHLYASRNEAAMFATAESTGQDREEVFSRLMDPEDGEYTDGDVTVYVVQAQR